MTEFTHEPLGGEPASHRAGSGDGRDGHFGVRVESDRTWTVYHVFSGVPAEFDGRSMIRLGRAAATGSMLAMNRRNAARRSARIRLNPPRLDTGEIDVLEWR